MRRMPVMLGTIFAALLAATAAAQGAAPAGQPASTAALPAPATTVRLPQRLINGETQMRSGNYSFAESMLSDLLHDSNLPLSLRARAMRDLATTEVENGEAENAIVHFSEAMRLNPSDSSMYTGRGNAYRRLGKQREAITDYTSALKVNPRDSEALLKRGMSYSARGDTSHALADYDAAIALSPNLAQARIERGLALLSRGEYDRAIADFDVLVRLQPTVEQNFFNRANAYLYKKDYGRAIADYTQALRLNPSNTWALTNRAICLLKLHDFEHAREDYKFALQVNPANRDVHQQLAMTYYLLGDYAQAMAEYHAAANSAADETLSVVSDTGTLDPGDQYPLIWEFFTRLRLNQDPVKRVKEASARLKDAPWPAPILQFLTGELSAEQLTAMTKTGPGSSQRNRSCEVNTYLGELHAFHNESDAALRQFRVADSECPPEFAEAGLVYVELRRLSAPRAAATPTAPPRPDSSSAAPVAVPRR